MYAYSRRAHHVLVFDGRSVIELAGQVGSAMPIAPIYVQIVADIRSQIEDGRLRPGARLPTVAELRAIYDCSTTAVRNAMLVLRSDGLIEGRQGKGVYVARRSSEE